MYVVAADLGREKRELIHTSTHSCVEKLTHSVDVTHLTCGQVVDMQNSLKFPQISLAFCFGLDVQMSYALLTESEKESEVRFECRALRLSTGQ